jgi:2-phosphosulfolactate phosphatase
MRPHTGTGALDVRYATLDDCDRATGLVVVIDVIRAFTTAAHVLDRGAAELWPVAGVEEAFALRAAHPGVLLMGEEGGIKVDGFDAGNSPSQLDGVDFTDRIVVQRTSAGTQGIARSVAAEHMLAASFVCAAATVRAIRGLADGRVTFVVTGVDRHRDGDEDVACADYLSALLRGEAPDPAHYLPRVAVSTAGRHFTDAGRPELLGRRSAKRFVEPGSAEFPAADLDLATELDRFDFAMRVTRGERNVLRAM